MNNSNLTDLVSKYGSPFYIFKSDDFIDNYMMLLKSFRSIYPKYNIAYSYKTNYTPRICQIVKNLGGYAEVVSDMEYMLAKKIGYSNNMIIYNGPYKGILAQEHILNGGLIHIDNLQEVNTVCELANTFVEHTLNVAIRVNLDIGQNFISRFGIDVKNGDLECAFNKLRQKSNIAILGIHCHIGKSRDLPSWNNRVNKMINLADKFFNVPPKYIDLGSGMFSNMKSSLATQFAECIPTFSDYAEVVAGKIAKHYEHFPEYEKPTLLTEPGTTLISSYIDFVGKITSLKQVKGKNIAVLDCSKDNLGDICKIKRLPLTVYSNSDRLYENVDFTGYTCLEHDVIYEGYNGCLDVGDIVLLENVGGYSNVSKPPFISPNCCMLELNKNNEVSVIKRTETFDDVFTTYKF